MIFNAERSRKLGRLSDTRAGRSERAAQRAEAIWAEAAAQFRRCEDEAREAEEHSHQLQADQFEALGKDSVSGYALKDQVEAQAVAELQSERAREDLAQARIVQEEREAEARQAKLKWLAALNRSRALKSLLEEKIRADRLAVEERLELAAADDLAAIQWDRHRR